MNAVAVLPRRAFSAEALAYFETHAIRPERARQAGVSESAAGLVFPTLGADGRPAPRTRRLGGEGPKVTAQRGSSPGVWWPLGPPEGAGAVMICEGESDALAVWSTVLDPLDGTVGKVLADELAGIASIPGATSLRPDRLVAELERVGARHVVLALDGDDAGRAATRRFSEALQNAGLDVAVLALPDGRDLAEQLAQADDRGRWLADALVDAASASEAQADERGRDVFPLLTGTDLLALPEPSWLLEGLLPSAGLSILYGPSGSGKSFLALDWTLCVAAGLPWHGRDVEPRWVVYVAAEGRAGLGKRYRAWLEARGVRCVERVRFLADAVNLLDRAEVDRVRRTLDELPEGPGLLVVDTMARTMVGGDENAAKDVGRFIHAVDALSGDGAALVVHHTGHEGDRERGSSALGAAADARLQLARDGRSPRLTLTNPKQKDAGEHPPVELRLEPSAGSLVLSPVSAAKATEEADDLDARVFAVVTEHGPASLRTVRDAVEGRNGAIDASLKRLEKAGRIVATGKGKGTGYEACPHPSGTLGHGVARSQGGGVPEDGDTPVGGPVRGTPRDADMTTVPGTVSADADAERMS